ncbi:MAG: acetolactate synthase small subunit [Nitrospinota bacterium]
MSADEEKNGAPSHTIAVLVENKFGVLAKVASLFSARGYNIDSLSVGVTQDPTVSRITLVTRGDERVLEQIRKQLSKLIDTIKVMDMAREDTVQREMMLVKVAAPRSARAEILQIVGVFRARIVDLSAETLTIEITGDDGKIGAFLELLGPFGIKEIARTGKAALSRGPKTLKSAKG